MQKGLCAKKRGFMFKKKFHGGLFLFFFTLFALLFINTFSYAYMTKGYLDYTITTLHDNAYVSNSTLLANFKSYLNNITDEQKTILLNNINTYMDQQGISNLQDRNIFCLVQVPTLKFFICNNSAPGSSTNLDFYCIADNYIRKYSSSTIDYIYQINVDVSSNPTTINTFRFPDQTQLSGINFNTSDYTISQDGTLITSRNIATCGIPAGFQFVPLSNYNSSNKKACILQDVNGGYVEPSSPGGDTSSGDGLGNIVNPSGENTGTINLQPIVDGLGNIQNQISGDTTRIIENQNNNTQTIVNQLSGDTTRIIENTNQNIQDIFDTDNPDTSLSDILDTASGEFENPYSLDSINNAFINSFDSAMEEDFIISWSSHNFNAIDGVNVQLIPSGEINFSKLCRDNQALGNVKEVLSIICISGLGVTMLVEFYNLVLATFGIGNYFYAETSDTEYDLTSVDNDTGQVRSKHIIRSGKKRK